MKNVIVTPGTAALKITTFAPTVWITATFAQRWFADGSEQAKLQAGSDGKRREILFAVCAAESYILEWVRDDVLAQDFNSLPTYFPPGDKRGIREVWRELPKQLYKEKRVPAKPDWSGPVFVAFSRLVGFRDGFVHARASLPDGGDSASGSKPVPDQSTLEAVVHGWAINTVADLIEELHRAAATTPPSWVQHIQ